MGRASTGDSHRYGIFVKLPGYTLRGLVPVHAAADSIGVLGIQDPELRQQALHFLMPPGTQAWVKVESHRTKSDGSQVYACSMNVSGRHPYVGQATLPDSEQLVKMPSCALAALRLEAGTENGNLCKSVIW